MKTALALAGLALVLGGLAGCGDDSDGGGDAGSSDAMPTNASQEEFCGNFEALAEDLGKLDPGADAATALEALQDGVAGMRETGTPEGIPEDARNGLDVTLGAIEDLPADASAEDIGNLEDTLSEAEKADADAFEKYLEDECGSLG